MKNNFYRLQNWLFYIKLLLYNLCQYYHFFGPLQAPPYHWPLELFSSVFGPLILYMYNDNKCIGFDKAMT